MKAALVLCYHGFHGLGLEGGSNCVVLAVGLGRLWLFCLSVVPWGRALMGYVVFLWLGFVNVHIVAQEDKTVETGWGVYIKI